MKHQLIAPAGNVQLFQTQDKPLKIFIDSYLVYRVAKERKQRLKYCVAPVTTIVTKISLVQHKSKQGEEDHVMTILRGRGPACQENQPPKFWFKPYLWY